MISTRLDTGTETRSLTSLRQAGKGERNPDDGENRDGKVRRISMTKDIVCRKKNKALDPEKSKETPHRLI
ncbi:hypothetical protein HMPREF9141_0670 [Prevotella multiformis DSM 16608]|uniref:Uncharacterized protein n=1 Tax=Prevotella multiformis DSM 16608 TaxID=888743 RepID=F0F504_9BACT|nr:hypothetical protein HMPREF9141_0670 [Prevotella multiformis DSM 16608]